MIKSDGEYMTALVTEKIGVVWLKGSHYANVYDGWNSHNPVDCFFFAWEKDTTSMLDFTTSLQNYIETM